MMTTTVRTRVRIAAAGAAVALLLSACTSDPASEIASSAADSASAPVETSQSTGASVGATEPTNSASEACTAYFEMDLLNSTYAGGAVADGDMTEAQVRADFRRLLKIIVQQGKLAVQDGTADQKLVTNAVKMKRAVNALAKSAALSDMAKKQQVKFAKQSSRVEKTCARAGFALPEDNITARTAAGI